MKFIQSISILVSRIATKSLLCFFIVLLCFPEMTLADSIPKQKRVSIQLAPLSLIDFYNGSNYKLGTEIRVSRKISVSADFGGYFRNFNVLKNNKGFNADFRLKYQLRNSNSSISLSYFYKKQSFEYHDYYIDKPEEPIIVYTRKEVNCINLNFEQKFPFLKNQKAYVSLFAGLGMRFRNVHSSFEIKHDFDRLKDGGDSQTLYFVLIPGKDAWLNVNLGLRLGFYLF
jgi:hypothetical protein